MGIPPDILGVVGLVFVMLGLILIVIPFYTKSSKAWCMAGVCLFLLGADAWGLIPLDTLWQGIGDTLDGLV